MRWWDFTRCVMVACCALASGCGELPPVPEPPRPGPREVFPVELPFARDTEVDRANAGSMYQPEDEGGPVFVLNATRDGFVYFRQYEFDLLADDVEQAEVDTALRETMGRACRTRRETDTRAPVIHLHADRGAPWGVVRRALRATAEAGCAAQQLRILCRSTERPHVRRVVFEVVPEPDAPEPAFTRLEPGGLPDGGAYLTFLERYFSSVDHPIEPIPEDPRDAGLPAVPPEIAVGWSGGQPLSILEAMDDVAFEYVLFVLDGLRGGGAQAIKLDGAGFTLKAREHAVDAPYDPTPHPPLRTGGAIAVVVLCALVGWLAWRSRRPIRR